MGDLAVVDNRFKKIALAGVVEQLEEAEQLKGSVARIRILEDLEKCVTLNCPQTMKDLTIVQCSAKRKRDKARGLKDCFCQNLQDWAEEYIF